MQLMGGGGIPAVVKNLIILNVLVYLATWLMPGLRDLLALHLPSSPYFRPYQFLTYMFAHGGFFHILFNMYALFAFGSAVERVWDRQKFFLYYLVCGFGSVLLHMTITSYLLREMMNEYGPAVVQQYIDNASILGASGAVYGILLAFGMLFPNAQLFLLFPPIPIKAKWLVIGLGAIELFSGITNQGSNIAHFAHLGGMLVGLVFVLYWRQTGKLYDHRI